MKCSECGHEIPDEATFCPECGHKLSPSALDVTVLNETVQQKSLPEDNTDGLDIPTDEVSSPLPGRFCIYCGSPIPEGCTFCPSCGKQSADVDSQGNSERSDATQLQQPYQQAIPSKALDNTPTLHKKRHTGAIVVGILLAVLIVGCAGVATAHYFGLLGDPDFLRFLPMQKQQSSEEDQSADESDKSDDKNDESESDTQQTATVELEDLTGMAVQTARSNLASSNLTVGTITTEYSDEIPKDRVISQSVAPGKVPKGTRVDLVVSEGPDPSKKQKSTPSSTTSGSTYTVVNECMTWQEAEQYCEDHGGHLATIANEEEWNEVLAVMKQSGKEIFWLGGIRNSVDFTWVDGTPFTYNVFAVGEPNDDGGNEDYLAVFNIDGSWQWYDVPSDLDPYYQADRIAFVMEQDK